MHCPIASLLLIYRNKMIIFLHRSTHFPSPKLKKTKPVVRTQSPWDHLHRFILSMGINKATMKRRQRDI